MKKILFCVLLVAAVIPCLGQTRVFQGEIMGVSPVFLCLETEADGQVTGFLKYPSDERVVPLKGTFDKGKDRLLLKGDDKPSIALICTLHDRTVRGSVIKKGVPREFYAVDLRGEYLNECNDGFTVTLSEEGYRMGSSLRGSEEGAVETSLGSDGRICVQCDALNARLWVEGEQLVVDPEYGRPLFMWPAEHYREQRWWVFTPTEEFFGGASFVEFPEKDNEPQDNGQIARSEYIVKKWATALQRDKPAKEVKGFAKVSKALGRRMRLVGVEEDYGSHACRLEITFGDGVKKRVGYYYDVRHLHEARFSYFPQLDLLILDNEADGEEPICLGDSTDEWLVGDPHYFATSPDGQWRLSLYYPGGASDDSFYFLGRWDPVAKRYRLVRRLPFHYVDEWFWADNETAYYSTYSAYYALRLAPAKVKLYGSDEEYLFIEEKLAEGAVADYPWKRQVLMTEKRDTVAVFSGLRYEFVEVFPGENPLLLIVEVTGKGNGWHELYKITGDTVEKVYDGSDVRTYDCHGDGDRFENCEPTLRVADCNGDGWNDIAFTGTRIFEGSQERENGTEPVEYIFLYDPQTGHFRAAPPQAPWRQEVDRIDTLTLRARYGVMAEGYAARYYDAAGLLRKYFCRTEYPDSRQATVAYYDTEGQLVRFIYKDDQPEWLSYALTARAEAPEAWYYDIKMNENGYLDPYDYVPVEGILSADSLHRLGMWLPVHFRTTRNLTESGDEEEHWKTVRFAAPGAGDHTLVNENGVRLMDTPATVATHLLDAGQRVQVLEANDESGWYRIAVSHTDWTGYVHRSVLEPVEKTIE